MKRMQKDPDMLEEYDFSKGVQGKYAKRFAEGTNVVVIEPDVAKVFPDHESVNQALISPAEIIKLSLESGVSVPIRRSDSQGSLERLPNSGWGCKRSTTSISPPRRSETD